MAGTMEELDAQCDSFDDNIRKRKQARQEEKNRLQDLQDEMAAARKVHVELINEQGRLTAEAKVCRSPALLLISLHCWLICDDRLKKTVWQPENGSSTTWPACMISRVST